jgi:hypothetical protein
MLTPYLPLADTASAFEKGRLFEEYALRCLFPEKYFDLIKRAGYYNQRTGQYDPSFSNPDFLFFDKRNRKEFFVEAKFRTDYLTGEVTWTYAGQLYRYQTLSRILPTFLLLGLGDRPDYPTYLTLIPMAKAKYVALYRRLLKEFTIPVNEAITPRQVWKAS